MTRYQRVSGVARRGAPDRRTPSPHARRWRASLVRSRLGILVTLADRSWIKSVAILASSARPIPGSTSFSPAESMNSPIASAEA